MTLKLENPAGHRIQDFRASGSRMADDDEITVAFLGEQAVPAGWGNDRRSTGATAVDALLAYLREHQQVEPAARGRIRVV